LAFHPRTDGRRFRSFYPSFVSLLVTASFRIAVIAETFPALGGGIPAAHESLYRLLSAHHEVARFAFVDSRPSSPGKGIYRSNGFAPLNRLLGIAANRFVRHHDSQGRACACRAIAEAIPAVLRLSRELHRFHPDVVLVSDYLTPALALRKPSGARFVWMAHHNYTRFQAHPAVPSSGWYDLFLAHRLERRALRKADYVVFPSRYMEGVFRESLDPQLAGKVIPNAIDLVSLKTIQREDSRQRLGLQPSTVLVGIPSGGTSVKGERYVFEIIRRLAKGGDDVRFLLTGPMNPSLEIELGALGSAITVHCPGPLPHDRNLENFAACDLVVSPTLIENFSCALLEAQALGIPVVTFDTGGNRELVANGLTGWINPYLDIEALIAKSLDLIVNQDARARMGAAARTHAMELADPSRILAAFEGIFSELVRN